MLQLFQGNVSLVSVQKFGMGEWPTSLSSLPPRGHAVAAIWWRCPHRSSHGVPQVRHNTTSSPLPPFPFPLLHRASRGGQRATPSPSQLRRAHTPSSSCLHSIQPAQSSTVSSSTSTSLLNLSSQGEGTFPTSATTAMSATSLEFEVAVVWVARVPLILPFIPR
jgi:hypothetical protein